MMALLMHEEGVMQGQNDTIRNKEMKIKNSVNITYYFDFVSLLILLLLSSRIWKKRNTLFLLYTDPEAIATSTAFQSTAHTNHNVLDVKI